MRLNDRSWWPSAQLRETHRRSPFALESDIPARVQRRFDARSAGFDSNLRKIVSFDAAVSRALLRRGAPGFALPPAPPQRVG
jgi:hypothetical protein